MTMKYQNHQVNNRHLHKLAIQAGEGLEAKESPTLICSSSQYNGQSPECLEKKKTIKGNKGHKFEFPHQEPKSQENR